jgi:UDPglucose--hexose-1-phosphate uridylyltransferase
MGITDLHELRKDPLLGRWVAVLSQPKSPADYAVLSSDEEDERSCILCAGRERETAPAIMSLPGRGKEWATRVIPHFSPVFQVDGELGRRGEGMYDRMNGIGASEIIVESPEHSVRPEEMGLEQMSRVVATYKARMTDLEKDARLRYTLIYKNSGREAGAVSSHPVSYLASTPVIPKRVKEELDGAKQYFSYKERCIFCDITREELRVGSRVVIETRHFVAFCPYASKFPFESWILPKRHSCTFQEILEEEIEDMALILSAVIKKLRAVKPLAYARRRLPLACRDNAEARADNRLRVGVGSLHPAYVAGARLEISQGGLKWRSRRFFLRQIFRKVLPLRCRMRWIWPGSTGQSSLLFM